MPDFDRRRQLHDAAADALGDEPAETLMELLPPSPWDHLATKDDLVVERRWAEGESIKMERRFVEIELEFAKVHRTLSQLDARIDGLVPQMWKANLAFTAAFMALVLVVIGLR